MFFRRRTAAAKVEPRAEGPTTDGGADEAIDALADVLRVYGELGTDSDEESRARTKATFERWAKHVLVGSSPEDRGRESGAESESIAKTIKRDFRGAVRFFRIHRKQEAEHLTKSVANLRDAVWSFIAVLSKAALADGASDGQIHERMSRLRESVDSGDPERLKREATSTVETLNALLVERAKAQTSRMKELADQVRSLGRELEEAKREGELDGLTRLYNRACFDRYVERTSGLAALGTPASLIIADIDHFKRVNDQFGHPTGDTVLRAVADAIFRAFPRRDDLVARYGGEEFAIILRNTRRSDAEALADRLVRAVRSVEVPAGAGAAIRPTLSAGVAEIMAGEPMTAWIERADRALYRAKNAGRNRWASESNGEASAPHKSTVLDR